MTTEVAPPEVAPPEARSRLASTAQRFPRLVPMLVLVVLIGALDVATARNIPEVSPIDELNHIDFLFRGSRGELGQVGAVPTQEALRELCVRGSDYYEFPPCPRSGRVDPGRYFANGVNASANPPGYFVATGVTARALRAVGPGWDSLVTWGRALGALWLLAGCYLLLRAGELLGLDRRMTVVAVVLVAVLPAQLHASTTVNPDAAAFFAGAALLLAVLVWERGRDRWRLAPVALAAVVAMVLDSSNVVALMIALGYVGFRALLRADGGIGLGRHSVRYAWAALALVVGASAGFFGWEVAEDRLDDPAPYVAADFATADGSGSDDAPDPAPAPPVDPGYTPVEGIPFSKILDGDSIFGMFPPVADIAPPPARGADVSGTMYRLFAAAMVPFVAAALILSVLRPSVSDRVRALGLAVVVALLAAPIVFHLRNVWDTSSLEETVPRLAISALPAIALVIVSLGTNRAARALIVVLAAGLYLGAVVSLL